MSKPLGRFAADTPAISRVNWKVNSGDLDKFVLEVLGTLGKPGASVWYPITAYTLRMVAAARWRLWRQGTCALRCQTDLDTDRIYVKAAWDTASRFNAWTKEAARRGMTREHSGKTFRVLTGGKKKRAA